MKKILYFQLALVIGIMMSSSLFAQKNSVKFNLLSYSQANLTFSVRRLQKSKMLKDLDYYHFNERIQNIYILKYY